MSWDVEGTGEFVEWLNELPGSEQSVVASAIDELEAAGPHLRFPRSSAIHSSRHPHMRELRIQHRGRPIRVLYAFDPRRTAVLLLGGDKTGDVRWYERNVPIADGLYDVHLRGLRDRGVI